MKYIAFLTFVILFSGIFCINPVFVRGEIVGSQDGAIGYAKDKRKDLWPYTDIEKVEGGGTKYLHTSGKWIMIDSKGWQDYQDEFENDEDFDKRVSKEYERKNRPPPGPLWKTFLWIFGFVAICCLELKSHATQSLDITGLLMFFGMWIWAGLFAQTDPTLLYGVATATFLWLPINIIYIIRFLQKL